MIPIEPYRSAETIHDDSWGIQPGSGIAYPVTGAETSGLPSSRLGGAPAYAPPAWGSMAAQEYANVTGWQVVTDLDGAGGQHIAGRLMAAYWSGRLWLKITGDNAPVTADAETQNEQQSGAGYLGTAGIGGLPTDAPSRAVTPQLYICPMAIRDNYLKTDQGTWRADVWWEVLANYSYHPEPGVWQSVDGGGWAFKQAIRVTIWAIACGNVLCFHTTASPMYTDDLMASAPVASRLAYSAWGLPYEAMRGYNLDTLTAEGGPFAPYWCALLPWEQDNTTPYTLADDTIPQPIPASLGTENYLGSAGTIPHTIPPAIAAPLNICGRYHYSPPWGIAQSQVLWPWEYGSAYGNMPDVSEFTGYTSWLEAVQGYLINPASPQDHTESAQDYCFDPASIEGQGILMGYHLGWYTPGETIWPPTAAPYEVLTAAELASPFGRYYLAIAGSTADGILLTASCFAEPGPDDIGDDPGPAVGPTPNPEPHPQPGPGPWNPPAPDPDEPDDPDPPGGATWLPDGYYYIAGSGVTITADRSTERTDGVVTAIRYDFSIDVSLDIYATASTRYRVDATLSTTNGGSYTYQGGTYTMYYGFAPLQGDTSAATVTWKSSYMYDDSDSKNVALRTYIPGTVTVAANFPQSGSADSESLPTSNILAIRNTGRTITRSSDGVKRQFHICTIALKTETLKGIMLRKALNHTPAVQLGPASATGINSGPPDPPTVTASLGTVTIAHDTSPYTDYPSDVTGCLIPDIAADYSTNGGIIAGITVSGSATWLYGDDTRANGSIDARFNITLPDQSTNL